MPATNAGRPTKPTWPRFAAGDLVEAKFFEARFGWTWFEAKVLGLGPRRGSVVVRYEDVLEDWSVYKFLKKVVDLSHVRPRPTRAEAEGFQLGDAVEAFSDYRWLPCNVARWLIWGRYEVLFPDGSREVHDKGILRRRLDWVQGEWKEDSPKPVDATNKASEPTSETKGKRMRPAAGNTRKSKFKVYSSLKGRKEDEANLESHIRYDAGCSEPFTDDDIGEPTKNKENRSGSSNGIPYDFPGNDSVFMYENHVSSQSNHELSSYSRRSTPSADGGFGEHAKDNESISEPSIGNPSELAEGNYETVLEKHVSSHSNHELVSASGKATMPKTVSGQFNRELAIIEELTSVKMTLTSVWDSLLSLDVFKAIPQCPHFRSLEKIKEDYREGIALGHMANFAKFADNLRTLGLDDSIDVLSERLGALEDFEQHGFNVEISKHRIESLMERKRRLEIATQKKSMIEAEISQNAKKCSESACVVDDINNKLKELEDRKTDVLVTIKECERMNVELERKIQMLQDESDKLINGFRSDWNFEK